MSLMQNMGDELKMANEAALSKSSNTEKYSTTPIAGYDFNNGINYHQLLESYKTSGFQATNFGIAVEQINEMVN